MSTIKNPTRFAELEYCLQGYFDGKLAPVMKQVRDDLTHKQLEERGRYQSSLAGVLASANPYADNTEFVLKQTGKWNSKTTEDYLAMCNQKIWKDKNIVKDLALLAGEWRNAVVKEIGRSIYDALSKACGEDLAYAYVAQRMEDLMIGKLVKDNTPKSTMDYILRKAAQNSIWGLQEELLKSPLTAEIEARGEKAYKPSKTEKFAGRATASVVDAVTMGGIGSWKSLATLVGERHGIGLYPRFQEGKRRTAERASHGIEHQQGRIRTERQCLHWFSLTSQESECHRQWLFQDAQQQTP